MMSEIPQIPHKDFFTLEDIRDAVETLIEEFPDNPGLPLLGFIRGMLAHTECSCRPVDTGHRATVVHLKAPEKPPL